MGNNNVKFCADCGENINAKAEICPKCGVRQVQKKSRNPLITVIIVVIVAFVGLSLIGIISAVAIPQFSSYRIKGYNSAAVSDIKNAKTNVESYFADNQKYPDSLDATGFKKAVGVQIEYEKQSDMQYIIISTHEKGTKLYQTTSEAAQIFQRDKSDLNAQMEAL